MANPRFAWGIDVGNRALKAVKLVRDGSGSLRIDDVDVIEHEHILSDAGDNKEALIVASLQAFSTKHPERGGAVAIGVSGQSSFARFIKLPPVEDKKIPEIVKFEAIQQIPFPLDDVEWSYQLFQDEGSPEKEVGIFAMRKELVNHHIQNFTNAGLNVQTVQMSPLAVYNAMYYDQRIKGTTMIVDVGAENTDLTIAEGEQIWLRSIPVGGNNFTEALVKQFKLKFPKGEELKRNAATSKYTRQILQAMRPVFDNLVAEIQRSIGFYASVHREARISRVIALGGTFRLPGLMKFLQMQLQLDVQRFDALGAAPPPDARVATLLNDNVLSTVGAYGLAVQAMGEGKITSSLLPFTIQKERMWREKTKWFAAAAALVVLGTGVAVGRYYYDRVQYETQSVARTEIATQLSQANALAKGWSAVEASGEPERKQIASLQSLTKMRELQAMLIETIDKALPHPKAKPEGKRAERQVVLVEDISPDYYDDLTPALSKTDDRFTMPPNEFVVKATSNLMAGRFSGGANTRISTHTISLLGMGSPVPAAAPVAAGSPAAPTGPQRGYLITLTCRTPMAAWTTIAEGVRNALLDATKPVGQEKQKFRIERVEIVKQEEIKNIAAAVRARVDSPNVARRRAAIAAEREAKRRAAGIGLGRPRLGGDAGDMEGPGPRYPRPYRQPSSGGRTPPDLIRPGQNPQNPIGTNPDDNSDYPMPQLTFDALERQDDPAFNPGNDPNVQPVVLDPVTGEDATNDNRLTFLVAVVLDPAPPAPPAPATPTDGSTPPAAAPTANAAPAATNVNNLAQAPK